MPLKEYQRKRSFDKTSEPRGGRAKSGYELSFVVQKHNASHLHYDFRLENRGVLVSWAVPKGPSLDPGTKRLAMKVEDHPYDYKNFEGEIPDGNYGAGQVIVWDQGTFQVVGGKSKAKPAQETEFRHGLHQGKINLRLNGQKLNGGFSLVKSAKPNQDNAWLLIKKRDGFASNDDVTKKGRSVISGQPIDEVGHNLDLESYVKTYKLKKAAKPKNIIRPMLATLADKPFSGADWLFEVKWDGYRAVADTNGGDTKLYSRRGQDFRQKYSVVAEALRSLDYDAILDGEVVVLDDKGRSDFGQLQNYDSNSDFLAYYIFDLLWLNGYDLTNTPLITRKEILKQILPANDVIRYSDHIENDGEEFFELARERKLEGIMAKRKDSGYQAGKRTKSWLKVKTSLRQEVVIGGFTEPRGSRQGLGSLILGTYDGSELVYVGHSGGGLSGRQLIELRQELESIEQPSSPFKIRPKSNSPVHWVKPIRLAEVSFSEWTGSGHMRHPRIVGFRNDKPARKVIRERPANVSKDDTGARKTKGDRSVEFSHLNKIFWPELKLTKGDLVAYYQTMASFMMPYIKDRPVSLLRHPNGVNGKSFFQKDVDDKLAKGFETYCRHSESNQKDVNYFVTDSETALLYQVQLGCIEINPWNSTTETPQQPDWLVLDLDPEMIDFGKVVDVALAIKDLLEELDLKSFPKTSGKSGIHIYLPLDNKYDYEPVKQLAELLARETNRRLPDITSVERSPAKRQGKVYIDFLQNRLGQTLAAPYSVRPTYEATVAMPLSWGDVNKKLSPGTYTLENAPGMVKKRKDPWVDFWRTKNSIERAVKKYENLNRD